MFSIFKKKSPVQKLNEKYKSLLEECYKLSKTNRKAADEKMAEAEQVLKEIEALGK